MNHDDQKKCATVSEWWQKFGKGHPIQVPGIIEKLMNEKRLSFTEAYEFVFEREQVVIVKGEEYVNELINFLKRPYHFSSTELPK